MDLRRLRYFLTVAEERNFSRAARRLHMAQPPLSVQIKNLEAELGVRLFERGQRPLRLTPAGHSLLADSRKILDEVKEAELRAQKIGRGILGHLRIGYIAPLAHDLFASILREFRSRFPEVEIALSEMNSAAQIDALLREQLDVGLLRPIFSKEELHFEDLFADRMVLAVPTGHDFCSRKFGWMELRDVPLILLHPHTAAGLYNDFLSKCQRSVAMLGEHQMTADIHTALWLVSAGFGVSPTMSFLRRLARINLSFVDLPPDAPAVQTVIARRDANDSPAVLNFFQTARDILHARKFAPGT
jgi:DNA-binding transcriptional LysR family regulator